MTTDIATTFTGTLAELGVTYGRTPPDECASAIADAVTTPAVGIPLSYDGATLPEQVNDDPTVGDLEAAKTGVTPASFGIAEYGSVFLEDDAAGCEPVSLFNDLHVVVLRESDLFSDLPEAVDALGPQLRDGTSGIVATGASATADMGALVKGAHGPKDVHVVLLEEQP